MTATPRPWRVEAGHPHYVRSSDGEQVARCIGPAGPDRAPEIAALICRAVNAHDELVATLKAIMAALDQPVQRSGIEEPGTCRILRGDAAHAWELARSALALIKEA